METIKGILAVILLIYCFLAINSIYNKVFNPIYFSIRAKVMAWGGVAIASLYVAGFATQYFPLSIIALIILGAIAFS